MGDAMDALRAAMAAQGKVDPDEVLAEAATLDPDSPTRWEAAQQVVMEQESLMPDTPGPITWEDFFTAAEVETTKRVRRGQQQLGPLARRWIAERVDGTVGDGDRSAKQFVNTRHGQFRIALSVDSDNTTETAAHDRMGVRTVHLENVEEAVEFFREHDLPGERTYEELRLHLRMRLRAD